MEPLTLLLIAGGTGYLWKKHENPSWSPMAWLFSSPFDKHVALEAVKHASVPTPGPTVALDPGMTTDQVKQVNDALLTETDPAVIAAHAKAFSELGHESSAAALAAKASAIHEAKALGASDADVAKKQIEASAAGSPGAEKVGFWGDHEDLWWRRDHHRPWWEEHRELVGFRRGFGGHRFGGYHHHPHHHFPPPPPPPPPDPEMPGFATSGIEYVGDDYFAGVGSYSGGGLVAEYPGVPQQAGADVDAGDVQPDMGMQQQQPVEYVPEYVPEYPQYPQYPQYPHHWDRGFGRFGRGFGRGRGFGFRRR